MPSSAVIAGHLYIAGGRDTGDTTTSTLFDYDIAANTWSGRASMPLAANAPGGTNVNGQLWVLGGGNPFSPEPRAEAPDAAFNSTQIYDPATQHMEQRPRDEWTRAYPGRRICCE